MKTFIRIISNVGTQDFQDSHSFNRELQAPGLNFKDATLQVFFGNDESINPFFIEDSTPQLNLGFSGLTEGSFRVMDAKELLRNGPSEQTNILFYGTLKQCSEWKLYKEKVNLPQAIFACIFSPILLPFVFLAAVSSGAKFADFADDLNLINIWGEIISDFNRKEPELPF
jgi:hypothetical protein